MAGMGRASSPAIQRRGRSVNDVAALIALWIALALALSACGSGAGAETARLAPAGQDQASEPAPPARAASRGQSPSPGPGQTGQPDERPTVYVVQRPDDPVIHLNQAADLGAFARPRDTSRDPKR